MKSKEDFKYLRRDVVRRMEKTGRVGVKLKLGIYEEALWKPTTS